MKQIFITLFFALLIGFGAKAQYDFNYTTTSTKKDYNGDNRNITIVIDFTLDSLYRNYSSYPQGHYGFYFSYSIKFYHNNYELASNEGYLFDNLRLKFRCNSNGETDFGLPLNGGVGSSLAYNSKYSNNLASETLESLGCDQLQLIAGGPGLSVDVVLNGISTLPIELITFDAFRKDRQVELLWKTASENNNDYFTIERSVNGKSWENIQTVQGAGNSSQVIEYSWLDNSPYSAISYYRLKQTDYDGTTEMFNIVSVQQNDVEELQAYPNPVSHTSTILGVDQNQALRIFNTIGVEVTGNVGVSTSPSAKTFLNMSQLPKGMYYVTNGGKSIQLLKE